MQEIACTTVSARLITNLTTINGKTASRPIFNITLNNSTVVAQWPTEEYLRLGVHDLNHLGGDITTSFKIADETIVIHNNMVVKRTDFPVVSINLPTTNLILHKLKADPNLLAHFLMVSADMYSLTQLQQRVTTMNLLHQTYLEASGVPNRLVDNFLSNPATPCTTLWEILTLTSDSVISNLFVIANRFWTLILTLFLISIPMYKCINFIRSRMTEPPE